MTAPSRSVAMRRRLVAIAALIMVGVAVWFFAFSGDLPGSADKQGAEVTSLTIKSKAVGLDLPVEVVVPKGAKDEQRPLLVFLHGRDGNQDSELVDEMFSALADEGDRAPVIAFPYGGEVSYWHDRAGGNWGQYVTDEVIPEIESRFDVDPKRVAIGGISMGGYGAYEIAAENPGSFCAIGGHSPAIWQDAAETAPGAFDDQQDFNAHSVIAAVGDSGSVYSGAKLWLDAGDEDPFLPGDEALTTALEATGAELTRNTFPGGHVTSYWNSHWDDYLAFYAKALAGC